VAHARVWTRVEGDWHAVRAQAEPTFRAQLWRTLRTLAVVFLLMSGLGALFEDRGLPRGILNNPDMRPQFESKTKFADVKGVDEAKARAPEQTPLSRAAGGRSRPTRAAAQGGGRAG
jgi:hypothetical protein